LRDAHLRDDETVAKIEHQDVVAEKVRAVCVTCKMSGFFAALRMTVLWMAAWVDGEGGLVGLVASLGA
jgi:hypothetical protein